MSFNGNKLDAPESSALKSLSAQYGMPCPTEAYFRTSDGASLRYAHWQTSASVRRGCLLFLNGRTEFIEKSMETYAVLVQSGLDLWTLDWRGQGLSERALADPQKGHIENYQIYLDDLSQFVQEITDLPGADGQKLLLGHSMGGHLGLRFLHDSPGLIDQAILLAPMIDITVNRFPLPRLNRMLKRLGFAESYALGTGGFKPIFQNPDDPADNGTTKDYQSLIKAYESLSQDPARRAIVEGMVRDNPVLALGGPTSSWLDASFRSIEVTMAKGYAEEIETPVLILGGGRDRTVVNAQLEKMTTRLPKSEFRLVEAGAHELLMETTDIRQEVFDAFGAWTGIELDTTLRPDRCLSA